VKYSVLNQSHNNTDNVGIVKHRGAFVHHSCRGNTAVSILSMCSQP